MPARNLNLDISTTKSKPVGNKDSLAARGGGSSGSSDGLGSKVVPIQQPASSGSQTSSTNDCNNQKSMNDARTSNMQLSQQQQQHHPIGQPDLDESLGDILLQGSDYWNLEGTATSLLRAAAIGNSSHSGMNT